MAGDQLELLGLLAQHRGSAAGDVLVRGAVEAVAANLVVLIVLIGQGVHVSLGGHGLMERSVEHGDLRHILAHDGGAGVDAGDVGGVVERSQGDAVLQGLHDLVGDEDGGVERLAAVHHPVAHSVDLLHGADHAVLGVHQRVEHGLDGFGVGGHGHVHGVQGLLALHLGLIGELAVDADALAQALGQQHAGFRVEQLILQGRTACVDDENVHDSRLLFFFFLESLAGFPQLI